MSDIEIVEVGGRSYQVLNGTYYHAATPEEVVHILEDVRQSGLRIGLVCGENETGKRWDDKLELGRVGRSMGPIKIPLLINNRRCYGGQGILDHCVLQIVTSRGKHVLYEHPSLLRT
jgi:hypothetical protein